MMFELIKKRIIKDLVSDIACLGAIELEIVGHNLVAICEGRRLIHHGINKNYKPAKCTVDTFSEDSLIVSEYSTEQDYFKDCRSEDKEHPTFSKIEKDILHAIGHKKPNGPEKIYLITNQEEPPSFRAKFNASSIGQIYGERITFIDAREMAKAIYEQSAENADYASAYKQFFPVFSQNLDNYEYYGKLPAPCEGHVADQGIREALSSHFRGQSICVLHGVSGSGKTQAAIDFVHHNSHNFENYVWISGDDWPKDTSLGAIQRSRGGVPVNVAGLFNSSKTVLVIDSVERPIGQADFTELQSGFKKGGVVVVTSQSAIFERINCLPIPELSVETAAQILGQNFSTASDEAGRFIEACRFSPLILSMARVIIVQEGVPADDLYRDILASPENIAGRDGRSIMSKILNRLDGGALQALKKIANSGESKHDMAFLRYFIGISNSHRLQQLSILLPASTPGVVRIHDLVCKAACDAVDGGELARILEGYIGRYDGEMTPSVLREIHLVYKRIYEEHLRRGERDPDWLTYSLLQVEGDVKQEIHKQIYTRQITPSLTLASVMSIIDAKEVHSYTILSTDERKQYYKQCAEEFKNAFDEATDDDIKAELLHHRGKALRRCKQYQGALDCFNQLLQLKPQWHATHGQIAHLGIQIGASNDIREKGEESLRVLIACVLEGASSVPLRVSLAAISKLRSYQKVARDLLTSSDDVQKLADIIAVSALEGFGQFYEAFVSFTSVFGYRHSSCCVTLAEELPEMLAMPPNMIEKKQWVSACEAFSNTAIAASRSGKKHLADRFIGASIKFADAISEVKELKAFDARAVAKAYTTAEMPENALEACAKVPEDRVDHYLLYRKAEAQLAIQGRGDALESAVKALNLAAKDVGAKSRLSSYHDLLRQCYEAVGDKTSALIQARCALQNCEDELYKQTLADHVSVLEDELE